MRYYSSRVVSRYSSDQVTPFGKKKKRKEIPRYRFVHRKLADMNTRCIIVAYALLLQAMLKQYQEQVAKSICLKKTS